MLKTTFWRNAANALPQPVRARHMLLLERAEQWELALDAVVDGFKGITRQLHSFRPHAN